MGRRENTFRIDYSHIPKSPSYEGIHNFIGKQLGLTRENVLQLQPNRRLGCMYVKVSNIELAQQIVDEHDNKHEIEVEGKKYKLRIVMEDGAVEVRLYDLSEFVTNETVADFLRGYGEVLSVRDVLWDDKFLLGGVATGVRCARVIVAENIPSVVVIDGQSTSLSYKGQRQTCVHCNEFVHIGIPCVQNKKLLVQKLAVDQSKLSYANVTKLPTQPKQNQQKRPLPPKPNVPKLQTTASAASSLPGPSGVQPVAIATPGLAPSEKKAAEKPPKTKTTLMPPPSFPTPVKEKVLHTQTDGSETDSSQPSKGTRSQRAKPPSKKQKFGVAELLSDEDSQ